MLSVVAMVALLTGCPPVTPMACEADADCDNGEFCDGAETCDLASGECVDGTDPCAEGETCDEDTDTCVTLCTDDTECDDSNECTDDVCNDEGVCEYTNNTAACDDGDICTENDVCADGACAGTAIEGCCEADEDCDEGEVCDTDTNTCVPLVECDMDTDCNDDDLCTDDSCDMVTGECVYAPIDGCCEVNEDCLEDEICVGNVCTPTCVDDTDCPDDGDLCTTETCDAGACVSVPVDCDDGDLCTTDSCDSATGDCVNEDVVCDAGETCDPATGECVPGCDGNEDCPDDGLFCNGSESCDLATGACVSSGDPCDAAGGETCDEDLNECIPPMGEVISFTLELDDLSGTGGDDTFSAPLLFNAPTGTNVPSLQTGDAANGGDGADLLNATFNFGVATTVAPTLTSIEMVNITDFGTALTTLAGGQLSGVTEINLSNSTNTNVFSVTNLPELVDLALSNQAIGATLTFVSAASTANNDEMTIALNGLTGAGTTITVTTGTTNGVETLNIESNTNASSFSDIAMNGTTLTTVNVSGDANLEVTTSLDANVDTVDASASTGGVTLLQNNAGNFTFTGGAGDDVILLAATYTNLDTLDGAGGTDTLGGTTAVLGGTTANQTNVSNFEVLRLTDMHTTALNVSHFGSISEVVLDAGANGGTVTNATSGIMVSAGARATDPNGAGTLGVTVSGSGTTDTATYTLNDCDQTGAVTFTGVETLNLVSNLDLDGSAASGGANTLAAALTLTDTASAEKVVITGTEALTVTGAITANEVDASGSTEQFIMGATMALAGVTVKGGNGNDTLFGSTGADIIDGNAGNDTINPMAGSDIVTGDSGADTFRQASAAANGADRQTITDFDDTPTTGDVFNLNSGVAALDGTDNFTSSASIQTHSSAGNLTVNAAAEVVVVRSGTISDNLGSPSPNSLDGTNLITAIGGTITVPNADEERLFIVADTSGNIGVYFGDAGAASTDIAAGELTLVAVLQGTAVDIANLVFQNFSNGA